MKKLTKILKLIMLLCLMIAPLMASAAVPEKIERSFDFSAFRTLPVLHEGRVKPLDSFARIKLREYSGEETLPGFDGPAWLAETLFDPLTAAQRPLFRVQGDLRTRLELDPSRKLFSLPEIETALGKIADQAEALLKTAPENRTIEQNELLHLYENALDYNALLRAVSMILPLDIPVPARYRARAGETPDYLSLATLNPRALSKLKTLIKRKGNNPANYTAEEKQLALLSFGLEQVRGAVGTDPRADGFKIIYKNSEWQAPWQELGTHAVIEPATLEYLGHWRSMAAAWRAGDDAAWSKASNKAYDSMTSVFSSTAFKLEVLYNMILPFKLALMFYLIAAAFMTLHSWRPAAILPGGSFAALTLGVLSHIGGIGIRMFVLQRPPVGTLYEAVLFVSLVCAFISLTLFMRTKKISLPLPGILASAALLLIAPAALQKAESMEMLVAVLNTNFWLSTHVICITAGYGLSILAACLAHAYMFMRLRPGANEDLRRAVYIASLAALLLTAVGTALGGIWADQSWGRFWGWDPKENGALLIVLWLIWLQHGRVSGTLKPLAYMAGTAALNIIVGLAWFGVNLLNVGLHSYGFTSGIASGLAIFCTAEILIIAALWLTVRTRENVYAS